MSDHGSHFISHTMRALTEDLQVQHKKSTRYHPQANRTVEAFNKILETTLTKVSNANHDDWDLKIPAVLWAYRTNCKRIIGHTLFKQVYGQEVVIIMEYIVPSLHIVAATGMDDAEALTECIT